MSDVRLFSRSRGLLAPIVLAVGVLLALFVGCVAIVRTATPPP